MAAGARPPRVGDGFPPGGEGGANFNMDLVPAPRRRMVQGKPVHPDQS